MHKLRLVLFDVDGVLVDSLAAHLKICRDKNDEYGLGLEIPDETGFRQLVRSGTRISPMKNLFMAVGFPEEFADKATEDYRQSFRQDYPSGLFSGALETLRDLHQSGFLLGIVTGNVRANITTTLRDGISYFSSECIYTEDELAGASKQQGIIRAMSRLQIAPREAIFVGDQPADVIAAQATGVQFLGVSYGWGISQDDKDFPVARSAPEIFDYIAELT